MDDMLDLSQHRSTVDALEIGLKRINDGWCQGSWRRIDSEGHASYCITGAISLHDNTGIAVTNFGALGFVMRAMREYVAARVSQYGPPPNRQTLFPADFNDSAATSHKDVIAVMQRAYDLALFEEGPHGL